MTLNMRIAAACLAVVVIATAADAQDAAMDHSKMNHSTMDAGATDGIAMDDMPAHGSAAHGDHNPKFGGLVLMYGGLLHFEIVGKPEGGVELHLSDEMRVPMPALTVSDVTVEIERQGGAFESVSMFVSEAGDFWTGSSSPLTDQDSTTVHLAFIAFADPYVYALPLAAVQPGSSVAAPSAGPESVVAGGGRAHAG